MQFLIPKYVQKIISSIENAGGEAFVVGGPVRDMLLGKAPDDFDVTTSLLPEEIMPLFEKTVPTGLKHGTVTVIVDGKSVEVTTYRSDGVYTDSRHPENVSFVKNLHDDLARRDFTVNTLAYNEKTGIIDDFGGRDDLKNKILRAVGDPYKRFNEDALRILRLFRFSAQLGFTIEENTLNAAISCANLLENISRERIMTELIKTALSENPSRINPLLKSGSLSFCFLTTNTLSDNIGGLPKDRLIRFYAFLKENKADYTAVCKNLKTDKQLLKFCQNAEKIGKNLPQDIVSCKKSLSLYSEKEVYVALLLNNGDTSLTNKVIKSGEPYKISHLKIDGNDLKELSISGEKVGEVLELLLYKVIENPELNSKEKLIEISRNQ